ncbi:hypothetical protein [Novosphingobium jiangmenense]|uniref:Autotransporter domain-containing protein n=1 Tax=Novosphingobium jiangmenense TaxID=2791981 RepID=A0ABS0HCL7_9SPHN|nr:hypothetical protein [Novosphingobium jiangmenense]MBF9150001.1 hypothetical protein [Novosphingobium jiangmenense]
MRSIPLATRKQLLSASGLALATALVAAGPALRAQSFQATPTSTFGSVTINTTPTTTAITVSSPSAVINWTPTDTATTGGPIIFQTSGTTATFTNNPAANSDFTVLNRIIPSGSTRPIQFDGTVVSRLQSAAGGQTAGGTVFFYSPGGILIGASSVFDVGNLVLTTSDLNYNTTDGSFDTSGAYVFQPATVAGSQIVVSAGAQLGATTDGSYIAMVAPSVTNNGTITVNGSAALVAADAATITFSPSGLFDIQVDSGTSATGTVAVNNGTITGPAASGSSFFHRIYMVAVPKNDAITMAIGAGSSLGFDIAGAADVSGNTIVLSAGNNIIGGSAQNFASIGGGSGLAEVIGGDADFTSNLVARTTGNFELGSGSSAGLDFASNVFASSARGNASVFANAGGQVNFAANVDFHADQSGASASFTAFGGRAQLYATDGGTIAVAGDVLLSASAYGAPAISPGANAGDAQAGFAKIQANNGGQINIGGDAQLEAIGFGGQPQSPGTGSGSGTGGTAWILSTGTGGSQVNILGAANLDASGRGYDGNGCVTCTRDGGSAFGGLAAIRANGDSAITIGGASVLSAYATAGQSSAGAGGNATGGQVSIFTLDAAQISMQGLTALADASGGGGSTSGGSALGGHISLLAGATSGTGITINGMARLEASALGSSGTGSAGISGSVNGGSINLLADTTDITINGLLNATAAASGSFGTGATQAATGGFISVEARNGGVLTGTDGILLTANAVGSPASGTTPAGAATGGTVDAFANGGTIQTTDLFMTANGNGGPQFGSAAAGAGTGGLARLRVAPAGQLSATGGISVAATGRGGDATDGTGNAGNGTGGNAVIQMSGGALSAGGAFSLVAEGYGGGGVTAGSGQGGTVNAAITDASFTINGISYIGAIGSGGTSSNFSSPGSAGAATGGAISFNATRSTVHLSQTGNVTFEATGYAGDGQTAANGEGGSISLAAGSSTVDSTSGINLFSEGVGSNGFFGGSGGNGLGGGVSVTADAALTAPTAISTSTISISTVGRGGAGAFASAIGGVGGSGGIGQGGTITLNAAVDGGTISVGDLNANASGVGGFGASGTMNTPNGDQGGNGGAATGGLINVNSIAASGGSGSGGYELGVVLFNAGAIGGAGGSGGEGPTPGAGGNGGAANGGTINMAFDRGGSKLTVSDGLNVSADATGGNSGDCGITCTAAGGNAQGGSINFGSGGATTGNSVSIVGGLNLSAFAVGGGAYGAPGGNGTGGVAIIHLNSGLALTADSVSVSATGEGGDQFTALAGGNGTGGNASFIASGTSSATISGTIGLYSDGTGGDGRDVGANGGTGTGGISRLYSDGGTVSVTGGASVEASGFGGFGYLDGASGTGGAGTGGQALLTVGTPDAIGNNGSITVGGFSFVTAEGTGGDSFRGGVGTGGFVGISARQGTLSLDQTFATADGFGGYGQFGGAGGVAQGGGIEVYANSALEGASLVTINTLTADSSAFGGFGGLAATPTGNGGVGGDATAGTIAIFGTAGNGRMQIGSVLASASGQGGGGGDGLAGGLGGNGNGGFVQIGTASGLDTGTLNTGSGTYGSILTIASGVGGDGGSGDASTGTGGAGGSGRAGGSLLLVRGSSTTVTGTGSFNAHAQGGNGGSGATVGAGGDATVGVSTNPAQASGAGLVVTSRFQQPSQSGSLTAGDLNFSAIAAGGTGSVAGVGTVTGDAVDFEMLNSSLSGTNLSFSALADGVTAGALPDYIALTNSTANLSGSLSFSTPNAFSLQLDQSNLTAASVAIDAGNWVLPATAPASYGSLTGTSSVSLSSGQDIIAYANLSTQGTLTLQAVGRIFLGSLSALGAVDVTAGGSLTLGDVSSGDSIDLTSQAVAALGNMTAATSITVQSASSVTTGNLAAGTGTPSGANGDLNSIGITSGGNVQTGTIFAASDVGISAAGTLTTGLVRAYDTLLLAGSSATIDSLSIVNRTLIANASMAALGQTPAGFDKELVFAAAPVATNGPIQITNASGSGSLTAAAGGALTTGNIAVSNSLRLSAGGSATLGQLTAGSGTPTAGGAGLISIASSGNVSTGNLTSSGDVRVASGGGLSTGTVVGYDVLLGSVGDLSVTSMNVVNRVLIANSSMQALGQTANGFDKELVFAATPMALTGAVTISNNSTVGTLRIAAGTTVTTANVFAAGRIGVTGNGAMNFGSLQSQSDRIEVISRNGTVTASALLSSSDILASGAAGLTVGTVRGRDLVLLSSGNISVQTALSGAVFDPQTNQITNAVGRMLMANSTMLPVTGALPGSINYAGLFAATPIKTDGNINVGNVAVAGQIVGATAGSFTGAGMAGFSRIEVLADGLVTVGRRWGGPQVRIVSGDIAIIDNGTATGPTGQPILSGIRTSETGFVDLISTSTGTALIGDGLTGSGYALSNAEIGLISTSELTIAAVDQPNNATDMLIGNLSLTAGGAIGSSNLAGTTGRIIFASGNLQTQTPGGAIRVTGAINGTGFGQGNVIEFTTGRFELDAATGSINLTSASQSGATAPLGGTLEINAANIHVAAGSILDKLAADPFYTGRIAELNAPAAVQRPEGVIRALGLDLYPTGTLYIQNTGTVLNSAGFLADADFTDVTAPTNATPGSISIVVNGAFQTPTGIVSGVAAHDLVVNAPDADFTPYTADSQINGCLFTATACSSAMEGPDTIGAISGQIEIISNETLGSTPTFTESPAAPTSDAESDDPAQEEQQQQQQASEGEEAASSPIAPPPQLIDSRPLEPQSQVEQPVAGSGNPALIGSVVNENSAEGDDQ